MEHCQDQEEAIDDGDREEIARFMDEGVDIKNVGRQLYAPPCGRTCASAVDQLAYERPNRGECGCTGFAQPSRSMPARRRCSAGAPHTCKS